MKILECFSSENPDLGIAEISRMVGLPKPTVNRLLNTLEANAYLEKNPITKKYRLGNKIFLLATNYLIQSDIRNISLPIMAKIRDATKETISLSLLEGYQRILIDYIAGSHELVFIPKIGRRTPLYVGASSKAILAFLGKEKIEEIVFKQKLEPLTPYTIVNPGKLWKDLEEIRKKGYAESEGEREENLYSISAPVWSSQGNVIGSLAVGLPTVRKKNIDINAIAELIKNGAKEISLKLR